MAERGRIFQLLTSIFSDILLSMAGYRSTPSICPKKSIPTYSNRTFFG